MQVLVFGSKGMLGYAVTEYFLKQGYEVKELNRDEFDIAKDDHAVLFDLVKGFDAVVNCAGVIKPRIKVMSLEDVLKVNSLFPKNLAKACKLNDVKCIHVTTDCVYSGSKGSYDENDIFDADDLYGMSKNGGDSAECMVLRTSIIGEENGQSKSLFEWAKSQAGKKVNGFTNHDWNGVTTVYLAEVIDTILKEQLYKEGLFHIHSQNTVDKYELLKIFSEAYNLELSVNPVEAEVSCDRSMTSISELSSYVCTKTIKQQVTEMKEFFEKEQVEVLQ